MAHGTTEARARANQILARLPENEYRMLSLWLEPTKFRNGDVLAHAGEEMEYFYFITEGVVSLQHATQSGETVEIAMVGPEGVIGICSLFGNKGILFHKTVYGNSVRACRIRLQRLRQMLAGCQTLQDLLYSFMFRQMVQISQNLLCSRFHVLEQQLCKWILLRERYTDGVLHITQDRIAQLLGVRRAGVNVVIRRLQKEGLIVCRRGMIKVVDRSGIRALACECNVAYQPET